MVDTNLILVDGLPGSGKSTTAQALWLHLLRNQRESNWFYEHQSSHPIYRLDNIGSVYRTTVKKSHRILDEAFLKWRQLTDSLNNTGRITILESTFFQTTIGWLQLMDLPRHEILDYASRVQKIINEIHPVLVYFYQEDPAAALRKTRAQRGDWFENRLVSQISKTPFGRAHGIRDFDGVIQFLLRVRSITDEIYAHCGFRKIALETSARNWPEFMDRITDELLLPRIDRLHAAPASRGAFKGTYGGGRLWWKESIKIAEDESGLFFDDNLRTRLIYKDGSTFCIQGMCAELTFRERNGVNEVQCSGDLQGLPKVWKKLTP